MRAFGHAVGFGVVSAGSSHDDVETVDGSTHFGGLCKFASFIDSEDCWRVTHVAKAVDEEGEDGWVWAFGGDWKNPWPTSCVIDDSDGSVEASNRFDAIEHHISVKVGEGRWWCAIIWAVAWKSCSVILEAGAANDWEMLLDAG